MQSSICLNEQDIARLLAQPSAHTRADIAQKVARRFDNVTITDRERALAQDILGLLVHDAATLVRESLAQSLARLSDAPHDVIVLLARDIDEVALPILEESPVLSDDDLIDIVVKGSDAKHMAIAGRPLVGAAVSNALIETDNQRVVARLVANEGALIDEDALVNVAERYGDLDEVADPLVRRALLPAAVVARLVSMVSDRLQEYLIDHHELSDEVAADLASESRERATIKMLENVAREDFPALVMELAKEDRVSETLLLRAVCMGEIAFLEAAMAHRANLDIGKTWRLLHDKGPLGLRAIFRKARLPEGVFPAFRLALDVFHEMDFSSAEFNREHFSQTMLEHILTQFDGLKGRDLDFLICQLGRGSHLNTIPVAAENAA